MGSERSRYTRCEISEIENLSRACALLEAGMQWQDVVSRVDVDVPELATISQLVETTGAPAAGPLRLLLEARRLEDEQGRRVIQAQAGPKATLRLVLWLPLLALGASQLAGLGVVGAFLRQPILFGFLAAGLALLVGGQLWAARMIRSGEVPRNAEFMRLQLIASCLRAGLSSRAAIDLVSGFAGNNSEGLSQETLDQLSEWQVLSEQTGLPLAELVTSLSHQRLEAQNHQRIMNSERLSVRLMIPLGVSVLPAFVLIAVVPIAFATFNSNG